MTHKTFPAATNSAWRPTRRFAVAGLGSAGTLIALSGNALARSLGDGAFTHGVASGDPTQDSVILWTRFVPSNPSDSALRWEVAEDEAFAKVTATGEATALAANDWCVKADAGPLQPGRRYFYRFVARSGPSPTGRTLTAPARGNAPLTIAAFACAYLPAGHFRAYADAARREDVDLCAHVGDYIYEYSLQVAKLSGQYLAGRDWGPDREIVTYQDYCERYASYRSDPDLQELHRVKPFVVVWDDHEFTNDAWREGAQNHQPATEGDWPTRRDAAAKAWFDWLPVRQDPRAPRRIHHAIRWGDLAHLAMLDSRLFRDNQPESWQTLLAQLADADDRTFNAEALRIWRDVIGAPDRTVLGAEQEAWLNAELKASADAGAPWQVLIEGSVLGRFMMPAAAESWLPATTPEPQKRTQRIRARLGALGLPYDTPLWAGFPAARERLLAGCAANGRNVLAFGGETHIGWAFNLPGGKDGPAALEIACTAVTSSNNIRTTPDEPAREAAYLAASPELAWCDGHHWGYTSVRFEEKTATADFTGFRSITERDSPVARRSRLVAETTSRGVRPWAQA